MHNQFRLFYIIAIIIASVSFPLVSYISAVHVYKRPLKSHYRQNLKYGIKNVLPVNGYMGHVSPLDSYVPNVKNVSARYTENNQTNLVPWSAFTTCVLAVGIF